MPFLPFFIKDLGVKNLSQVEQLSGIAFSITFLAGCLMSPVWGKLADKWGRKIVLMCTGLGLVLTYFIFIFTPNVKILIVFRLLQGLVSGYNPAATSLVAQDMPVEKAGWALATLSNGQMDGILIGPVIGGYLNEVMPIRMVYFVTSIFLCVSFLASFFLLTASLIGKIADKTNYIRVLQISICCSSLVFIPMIFVANTWQLMVFRFLLGISQAGILPIVSTLLKRNTPDEISGRIFGYNQAAQYLGLVLGPLLGSEISAHFGFRPIFAVTSFILIINFIIITIVPRRKVSTC